MRILINPRSHLNRPALDVDLLPCYLMELLQEQCEDEFGDKLLFYRRLAIANFIKGIDSSLAFRRPKGLANLLNAETALWKSILSCAERMQTLWGLPSSPAKILYDLIRESQIVLVVFGRSDLQGDTASRSLASRQSENKKLQSLENPFDRDRFQNSWNFIETARSRAESNDLFRRDFYNPIWRERSKLCSILRIDRARLFTPDGMVERQNRGSKICVG